MKTYRLPEALGGGEVREADHSGDQSWPNHIVVAVFDSAARVTWYVLVPRHALTEVNPEPEDGSRWLGADGVTYVRHDDWAASDGATRWYNTNSGGPDAWSEIPSDAHPMVRLVPAPAPVELPWTQGTMVVDFDSHGLGGGPHKVVVKLRGEDAHILAIRAREMAAALITAADKADEQVRDDA